MSGSKRKFSPEFKLQVPSEADAGVSIAELCRRYEITSEMFYRWKRGLKVAPKNPFPGKGARSTEKAKMSEMERLIGRQAMEIDFLKNALRRLKEIER